MWLKGILNENTRKSYLPILNMDSQSAIYLCKDPVYHERTKHIDVRFHFIKDKVEDKDIVVKKIKGDINPADLTLKLFQLTNLNFAGMLSLFLMFPNLCRYLSSMKDGLLDPLSTELSNRLNTICT